MIRIFRIPSGSMLLPACLLAVATAATAQMGGMRGGYSGMPMGSVGGMFGGSLTGMMGGGAGLSIGADGTLYLTLSSPAQSESSQPASTRLAAIDLNGNAKWTLSLDGLSASQPAIGKDGTLFVTTSNWLSWMYDWTSARSTPAVGGTPNLLVIKPGATSATVVATVPLTGEIASSPQIAADNAGNYVVYVVSVDPSSGTTLGTTAAPGSYLYAFSPTGTLKYKMQLNQGASGMPGPTMMGGF